MFIYPCLSCFLCAQEVDRFSESFPSRDSKQGAVRPFGLRDMGRSWIRPSGEVGQLVGRLSWSSVRYWPHKGWPNKGLNGHQYIRCIAYVSALRVFVGVDRFCRWGTELRDRGGRKKLWEQSRWIQEEAEEKGENTEKNWIGIRKEENDHICWIRLRKGGRRTGWGIKN